MKNKYIYISFSLLAYFFLYDVFPSYLLYIGIIYADWISKILIIEHKAQVCKYIANKLAQENPRIYEALFEFVELNKNIFSLKYMV